MLVLTGGFYKPNAHSSNYEETYLCKFINKSTNILYIYIIYIVLYCNYTIYTIYIF